MAEISAVAKTETNAQQRYKFRGIEQVMNAAHPVFAKHGVFCTPEVKRYESQDRIGFNAQGEQKTSVRVTLEVRYTFYAPDGSSVQVIAPGEGIDSSDKASNKAMSAAMKYALMQLLLIPTEDIEDADRDTPDIGERPNGSEKVPVTTEEIPLERPLTNRGDLISTEQAQRLHERFRDELHPDLRKDAKRFLHDFLGLNLYLDENGNPSADAIPKANIVQVGKAALAFARSLKPTNYGNKEERI